VGFAQRIQTTFTISISEWSIGIENLTAQPGFMGDPAGFFYLWPVF
jgi:hypothetical protein